MFRKIGGGDVLLIGEQAVVHVPEFPLLSGAMGRLGSLLRVLVKIERIVAPYIFDLASVDVILDQLRIRLLVIAAAEGTLEVGEFDHRDLRIRCALEGLTGHADWRSGKRVGSRSRCRRIGKELLDVLELLENCFLRVVERIDRLLQIIRLSRLSGRRQRNQQE